VNRGEERSVTPAKVVNTASHHLLNKAILQGLFMQHGHAAHSEHEGAEEHGLTHGEVVDVADDAVHDAMHVEHEKHAAKKVGSFFSGGGAGAKKYHLGSSNAVAPEELDQDKQDSKALAVPVLY